jgi:hypothetical protein
VAAADFQALLKSPSKGRFFQERIRGRGIAYEALTPEAFEVVAGPQKPAGDEAYRQAVKTQLQAQRKRLPETDYQAWVRSAGFNTKRGQARTHLIRTRSGPIEAAEIARLTKALRYGRTAPSLDPTLAQARAQTRRARQVAKTAADPRRKAARRLVREVRREGDQRAARLDDYLLASQVRRKLNLKTPDPTSDPDQGLTEPEERYLRRLVVDTARFAALAGFDVPPERANLALKLAGPIGEKVTYTPAEWRHLRYMVRDDADNLRAEIEMETLQAQAVAAA